MRRTRDYVMIILALSYVVVHTLLMLSILDSNNPLNSFRNLMVYLMGIPEYLAITLYSIDFYRKFYRKVLSIFDFDIEKFWDSLPSEVCFSWSLDLFITIAFIMGCIAILIYGSVVMFVMILSSVSTRAQTVDVLWFSIFAGNMILSPCLAIDAHINKRHIEKYFHLLYMVFAPILPFIPMIDIVDYSTRVEFEPFESTILYLPLLFVLRNYYLLYRGYRKERKDLRKNGG